MIGPMVGTREAHRLKSVARHLVSGVKSKRNGLYLIRRISRVGQRGCEPKWLVSETRSEIPLSRAQWNPEVH